MSKRIEKFLRDWRLDYRAPSKVSIENNDAYPYVIVKVAASESKRVMKALRRMGKGDFYPVKVGCDAEPVKAFSDLKHSFPSKEGVDAILREARQLDIDEVFHPGMMSPDGLFFYFYPLVPMLVCLNLAEQNLPDVVGRYMRICDAFDISISERGKMQCLLRKGHKLPDELGLDADMQYYAEETGMDMSEYFQAWAFPLGLSCYFVPLGPRVDNLIADESRVTQSRSNYAMAQDRIRRLIAIIPTAHSWEIPAYLGTRRRNDRPRATLQVVIHKHWYDMYGAEMVDMVGANFTVSKPPKTYERALALAKEHVQYCPDRVVQGVDTLNNLAALLLNAKTWYFWWD